MSILKKLAGETALYGLSSIVGRFLNYLLVPIYTRTFLEGEYGVVSEFFAYSGFAMVLFSYRMESAFFRFGTPVEDRKRAFSTAMWSLLATTALLLGIMLLFSQPIANELKYPNHIEYVWYFAMILALDCLTELPFAQLRLEQRPRRFVAIKLLNIGLNIGFNLFWIVFCPWAAKQGYTWVHAVWSPAIGVGYVFIANLLASLVTVLALLPQIMRIQMGTFDPQLWRSMMRYAGPLVIVGFAGVINEMLDRVILTRLLPGTLEENRAQLGIYAANYKLAMIISLFTQAYRYAAEPFFFKNAGATDAMHTQANATKWFTIAACGGMLGILLGLDIIKGFLGARFHSGLEIVPILLLANVFLGIYYNFSVWYRLKNRTMIGAWISIAGAAVTLLLNLWWVPTMGYVGAAWATLACYIFMAAATWWSGRQHYPVVYPLGRMAAYIVATLGLYAISVLAKQADLGPVITWSINIVLFGVFAGWVWKKETL